MLRIHLLELSKLKKLIEKFKTKYTGILKKTFAHESDLNSLSDSDDDSFLDDIYASNYPITATGMFFPGPYMPTFPQIPDSIDVNLQNKNIFHNNGFNKSNEKIFYDQQNNYMLQLAYLANTHSLQQQQQQQYQQQTSLSIPSTASKNATVNPSTKKK
uniref:Uncharacterized protein n=1 Tax=Panagrolaimus sp. ES5 TaxID=591445 RepID=A0AC34FX50_9BILA